MRALIATAALAALSIAGFAATSWAAPTNCKVANARYEMMGAPGLTAGFRPVGNHPGWLTNVAFFVHSDQSKRTFWFLFDAGTARYITLISTTDVSAQGWTPPPPDGGDHPLGSMHYMGADSNLRFSMTLPRHTTPAPTYILLPDLSEKLRYGQAGAAKEDVPVASFKLKGC
jgi:hypothetical protein